MALDGVGGILGSHKAACRIRGAKGVRRQLPEVPQEHRGNSRSRHHLLGSKVASGANPALGRERWRDTPLRLDFV